MNHILFTCSAENVTQERIEEWAVTYLRGRGWWVEKPYSWETPKELAKRLGISSAHLSRTLKLAVCPQPYDIIRGRPDGKGDTKENRRRRRIVYLMATPLLEQFLTRHINKKPNNDQPLNRPQQDRQ